MSHLFARCSRLVLPIPCLLAVAAAQGPTWASLEFGAIARHDHAMVFDEGRGRALVFGGTTSVGGLVADTWEWNGRAWTQHATAFPPDARRGHAMAYDPTRGVVVLFGGTGLFGAMNDTWEWDGTLWTQRTPVTSPSARWGHAMAFHAGTNAGVLLHGGSADASTWRWNGTTWTLLASNGPPSVNCGMTWVAPRQRTYLLATTAGPTTPTPGWAWNGSSWTAVSTSAPSDTDVVYDVDADVLLAVGGRMFNGLFTANNLQVQVGTFLPGGNVVWSSSGQSLPGGFVNGWFGSTGVYDTARRRVLTFGGSGNDAISGPFVSNKLLEGPSSTGAWSTRFPAMTTNPGNRMHAGMAFDAFSGRAVLFGGWDGTNVRNDAWTFDGRDWTNHGASSIPARMQPALCPLGGVGVVLFGGGDFATTFHADTMVWSGSEFLPTIGTGVAPPARRDHDMVHDTARNRIVMFGGFNGSVLADTWELRLGPLGLDWVPVTTIGSPGPRQAHRLAYDARRGKVVLYGGVDQAGFDGSTWEYTPPSFPTPGQWTQAQPLQSPPRRYNHTMEYDPARGVVVVIGGFGNPQCGGSCASFLNDVWEYDGVTWTQRTPESWGVVPREGRASCYDPLRQYILMQGGGGSFTPPDNPTMYYEAPVDRFGQGMQGGSSVSLRCLQFPVAGRPTRLSLTNPTGLGWITVFAGPAPAPGITLGPGLLCGTGSFYGVPAVVVDAMGNPGEIQFTLPPALAGTGFVAQGISFDPAMCLRLSDPLALTIHHP